MSAVIRSQQLRPYATRDDVPVENVHAEEGYLKVTESSVGVTGRYAENGTHHKGYDGDNDDSHSTLTLT